MGKSPRIALFDIETSPNLSWIWGHYEQNAIETEVPWHLLSFAYKWLGEKRTKTHALPDYPAFKKDREDDKDLAKELWRVLDEADIVVAHNGDKFDIKKTYTRFLIHGIKPPAPFKSIDTLKLARKHFGFNSNRLNDLGKALGIGRKLPNTGFTLWKACMEGDPKAWKLMRRYNARDVELLERFYLRIRPYATGHPNLNVYTDRKDCTKCGSHRLQRRGFEILKSRKRQKYQCLDCGGWSSGEMVK